MIPRGADEYTVMLQLRRPKRSAPDAGVHRVENPQMRFIGHFANFNRVAQVLNVVVVSLVSRPMWKMPAIRISMLDEIYPVTGHDIRQSTIRCRPSPRLLP